MSKGDSAFGQIVWGELQRHFVSRQNTNSIAPESAGKVRKHHSLVFQLDAEESTRELF